MAELIKDLSKADFKNFALKDKFHTRGILGGISKEPLVWTLVETNPSRSELIFSVTYHGIFIGEYCVTNGLAVEI